MNEISAILREFRFTESEVKVYLTLVQNGPCSGYELSKLSSVPRSKIYNILEGLLQRGVLSSSQTDKATLYRAEPVAQLAEILRSNTSELLGRLEEAGAGLAAPRDDEQIWHLYDYHGVKGRCCQLIESAQRQVMVQIWAEDLDPRLEDCLNRKRRAIDKVLVVLYDPLGRYETRLEKFYRHGFEQEKLMDQGSRWITVTVDGEEMLHATIQGDKLVDGICTRNKGMVFFATEYVAHDAYCLRLIDHLREQVTSEFGTKMEGVRDIFAL